MAMAHSPYSWNSTDRHAQVKKGKATAEQKFKAKSTAKFKLAMEPWSEAQPR